MAEGAGDGLGRAEDHVKEREKEDNEREREGERKEDQPVCEQVLY